MKSGKCILQHFCLGCTIPVPTADTVIYPREAFCVLQSRLWGEFYSAEICSCELFLRVGNWEVDTSISYHFLFQILVQIFAAEM